MFYQCARIKQILKAKRGVTEKDPVYTSDTLTRTLANSEDNVCYDKTIFRERKAILFGSIIYDPSIYTVDYPKLFVISQKEESISA